MKETTCCFTGHRNMPEDCIGHIITRLNNEVESLIHRGVTDFISGGALGFDQLAAAIVLAQKQRGADIRLIFALPCKDQAKYWSQMQSRIYTELLTYGDEIRYISQEYHGGCMKKRNYYMVEQSGYCTCFLWRNTGGAFQTVNYARQQGVPVINIAGREL